MSEASDDVFCEDDEGMKYCSCLKKLLIVRPMLVVALFKLVGDFIQGIDGIGRHFTEQHAILVSLELGQKCDFVWTNLVGYGWWAGEIRPTENGDPASTPLTGTAGNRTGFSKRRSNECKLVFHGM